MIDAKPERVFLSAYFLYLMAEANGGKEPVTIWQYRRVGKRFGVRIRFVAADALQSALLRLGEDCSQQGVIYVRKTRNMTHLRLNILHELAEAVGRWEGAPPCVCQTSCHEIACAVVRIADSQSKMQPSFG